MAPTVKKIISAGGGHFHLAPWGRGDFFFPNQPENVSDKKYSTPQPKVETEEFNIANFSAIESRITTPIYFRLEELSNKLETKFCGWQMQVCDTLSETVLKLEEKIKSLPTAQAIEQPPGLEENPKEKSGRSSPVTTGIRTEKGTGSNHGGVESQRPIMAYNGDHTAHTSGHTAHQIGLNYGGEYPSSVNPKHTGPQSENDAGGTWFVYRSEKLVNFRKF